MSDLEAIPEYDFLDDDGDQINYEECAAILEFENNGQGQIRRHIATVECDENDDVQNEEIPIYPGADIRVGRSNKCDVVIDDDRVSKQHFRIYSIIYDKETRPDDPPLIYCEDLQSFNGTFVNDLLIGNIYGEKAGYLLSDGDVIEIRPYWKFRFHQPVHQNISLDKALTNELQYFQDRYVIFDRKLGDGEYGAVWLAQEVATKKQVACKIVDLNHASKRFSQSHFPCAPGEMWEHGLQQANDERMRVLREIKILAQLSHPNIVNLKKAFCSNTTLYMFTALAAGGDLFSYLVAQGGQLDDWNGRAITRQIALAMTYIHSKGIAHRDIKPENILITQTDFGGRVVLTDFGFANNVNARTGRMMSILGTQGYIAPEIWTDGGHTIAADLWSFGILTVRVLTGLSVRDGIDTTLLDEVEIAVLFVEAGDRYSREQWLALPPRALQFIQRLLIVVPEQRMTASETLKHEWYKMPLTEAAELEEGYKRVIASWESRETGVDVMEDLPGRVTAAHAPTERVASKTRKSRIPDTSSSPYFGLDRHLMQKIPSQRKDILANLSQSGSRFITETSQDKNPVPNTVVRRDRIVPITSVKGSDIFGKSQRLDLDEVALVPATPIASPEKAYGSPVTSSLELAEDNLVSNFDTRSSNRARKRKGSWDPEDRRIHDIVAKQLPRYTTAKAMKDAVNKIKKMAMVEGRVESVCSI